MSYIEGLRISHSERFYSTHLCYSTYSTVQYSTAQYSTVQYSTVQHSTAQYSTVQYSTAKNPQIQTNLVFTWYGLHYITPKLITKVDINCKLF